MYWAKEIIKTLVCFDQWDAVSANSRAPQWLTVENKTRHSKTAKNGPKPLGSGIRELSPERSIAATSRKQSCIWKDGFRVGVHRINYPAGRGSATCLGSGGGDSRDPARNKAQTPPTFGFRFSSDFFSENFASPRISFTSFWVYSYWKKQ